MKFIGILNLVFFLATLAIQTLALVLSPYMSSSDIIAVLGSVSGVILSVSVLFLKKNTVLTTIPFGLVSVFVYIVTIGQVKYWLGYYNDGREDYTLFFIVLYSACLLSSFILLLVVLRQIFLNKQIKADT